MTITRKKKTNVRASRPTAAPRKPLRNSIRADEEMEPQIDTAELLFEADDVADVLAEVTGEDVTMDINDEGTSCTLTVGEDEFQIDATDAEVLMDEDVEASRKTRKPIAQPMKASRTVRRVTRK